MKKTFTSFVLLTFCACCFAQNYATGKRSEIYVDASRNSRQIPSDVYYPADAAGNNVALASGGVKFPVVVFGHGFVISTSSYQWLGDSLSQKGYIVVLPSTEGSISPSHTDFGKDLGFLCNYVTSLNDSASSFLYQRVMKKSAVGGHSMGGGCSYLAAAGNTSINAIFNFSAAETNPSAITAASSVTAPALVYSGSSDCIVPDNTQQSMYNNINDACKTYIDITNALHCQYANNNTTCVLGQVLSGCNSSSITPSGVFKKVTALLIPFLNYYLKNDCSGGDIFLAQYANVTGVTKMQSCQAFPSCGVLPVSLESFYAKKNKETVTLNWNTASSATIKSFIIERSADGSSYSTLSEVAAAGVSATSSYSTVDKYPYPDNSFYRLKMIGQDGSISYSTIIKIVTDAKALAVTRLFPNPVSSVLHFELVSSKNQKFHITVSSGTGSVIADEYRTLNSGISQQTISSSTWQPGYYIVQFRDEQAHIIASTGIIKL